MNPEPPATRTFIRNPSRASGDGAITTAARRIPHPRATTILRQPADCANARPARFVTLRPAVRDLIEELMDSAARKADYAEARHVRSRGESIATRNGAVDELTATDAEGVGVRVRVGGAWGFAATRELDRTGLERALERALAVAEAQP